MLRLYVCLCVLYMKQQYILKRILLRGVTLFSTCIISQIPCFIVDLLLYIACLFSCFSNSKMVTECKPKPISMNFGSPGAGRGRCCVEGMVQNMIGQNKRQFQQQYTASPMVMRISRITVLIIHPLLIYFSNFVTCQLYPTYLCCNKDLSRAMFPNYYRKSCLTFC